MRNLTKPYRLFLLPSLRLFRFPSRCLILSSSRLVTSPLQDYCFTSLSVSLTRSHACRRICNCTKTAPYLCSSSLCKSIVKTRMNTTLILAACMGICVQTSTAFSVLRGLPFSPFARTNSPRGQRMSTVRHPWAHAIQLRMECSHIGREKSLLMP